MSDRFPTASTAVPDLDPVAAARWRRWPHAESPWLHEEVGARMVDRLRWIRQPPQSWISWSPLAGGLQAHRAVAALYPEAALHWAGDQVPRAQDLLQPAAPGRLGQRVNAWWQRWRSGASPVPDSPPQVDLVWANMLLHADPDPVQRLTQWRDLIRQDGFLMFSCLGPDTLVELRTVHQRHGWPGPAPAFTDMHDLGDMMVAAGFAEPVMQMERLTLTYQNAERLLQDLRAWGRNLHRGRFPALRGRGYREAWLRAVDRELPRDDQNRLRVTVEVIYGHAFKPAPRLKVASETTVALGDLKAMLRRPTGAA